MEIQNLTRKQVSSVIWGLHDELKHVLAYGKAKIFPMGLSNDIGHFGERKCKQICIWSSGLGRYINAWSEWLISKSYFIGISDQLEYCIYISWSLPLLDRWTLWSVPLKLGIRTCQVMFSAVLLFCVRPLSKYSHLPQPNNSCFHLWNRLPRSRNKTCLGLCTLKWLFDHIDTVIVGELSH